MKEFANGFEFLESLKKQSGNKEPDYTLFSRYIAHKARERGVPLTGQFELTPLCNFNCGMCYVHLMPEQMHEHSLLSADEWKSLFRQAVEAGMYHANLTGGECLTYPAFDELFLDLHSLGCEVGVLTNGYLLDDRRIQFFREHMPSRIQITLYGWNDDVYERVTGKRAFSTVSENIRKAIEAGLPVSLTVTPSDLLGDDVLETIRLANRLCRSVTVNSCLFTPREETGRADYRPNPDREAYLRIYRLLNEMSGTEIREIAEEELPPYGGSSHECKECGLQCGGGREVFVVDWKGTMMPCNRLDVIQGFPLKEGFRAAWTKVNQAANSWPRVPECNGCAYREVCSSCAADMLEFVEPGKQPIELCEQTKFFVQHGIRRIPECEK